MNICVIGGGNMGHYITAIVGKKANNVRLLTREHQIWSKQITAFDDGKVIARGDIDVCTDNAEKALEDANVVLITWPTNVLANRLHEIEPFLVKGMYIGFIPGFGGKEFICNQLRKKGCILFGTQRVISSTKILEYGLNVECINNRPNIKIAAIQSEYTNDCCEIMKSLFDMECVKLPNYLTISLTPSNPILHTARVYSLFRDYQKGQHYDEHLPFYRNWSDQASQILLSMNDELQSFCHSIPEMDLTGVTSLDKHYEIGKFYRSKERNELMTMKMKKLKFLKDAAPMKKNEDGYSPDYSSRYFQEDFSYGLTIIKGFCEVTKIQTPQIDIVLQWYCGLMGLEYFTMFGYNGKDLAKLPIPVNMGLKNKQDLIDFYTSRRY